MDTIRSGKWGGCIALVSVLLCFLTVISAQPEVAGFLSIDCGGKTNYTSQNNIAWVPDANYIEVGRTAQTGNADLPSLRLFPKPLNKSCYQLPIAPNVSYLLRVTFVIGNYSGFQKLPTFAYSIETVDMLAVRNITFTNTRGFFDERILASSAAVLYVCLIRTSESDDPFISAIELRAFRKGMYGEAKPGTMLIPVARIAVGRNSIARYPLDNFDRIWIQADGYLNAQTKDRVQPVSSEVRISTKNTKDFPPIAVMQNAWVVNSSEPNFGFIEHSFMQGSKSLLLLYFAEIQRLNMSQSRSFYITINGVKRSETITMVRNYSAIELPFLSNTTDIQFNLVKAPNSTVGPIINAFEYYILVDTQQATFVQDIEALVGIKRSFNIKDWISDPCYLIQWKGIGCVRSSSTIRISEIDLSRRNLTGSVPKDIGQLTALVNVSLHNNHLTGPLPNFSTLAMLERLYLHNNNLTGIVPEWLSELKNLKELHIENNNFSGVIPAKLILNRSLRLSYSGNPYLCMHKGECILQNSNKNKSKLKVVLGITLSGILIIAIALIVGIVVYRNKLGRKEHRETIGVEKEPKPSLCQDYSTIVVPNPTKSRAFTVDELMAATQTFSCEIGRGGFGSVFFGKLPEGKNIAVKVLSSFSQQGVKEFLNEVDLLSRINHRNLVSLLGYCSESREVMLIYEHMSRGSLRDHLYGPKAEHTELNWKTRLKITLDAAQGLEYLHVGSKPKIIHRDVKTANILLDSNLNGKLADFGLSRMAIDEDNTHVTTAVKGTFGYVDPEYFSTQMLTEKSDVYSFGVVLLEIICGRQPIDAKLPTDEVNIIRWVTPYIVEMDENPRRMAEIIDKRLRGNYDMKSINRVAKVAMRCVLSEPSCRPTVSEVMGELKKAMNHEDKASFSVSGEIAIDTDDLLAGTVSLSMDSSEQKEMEWSDNSTNISKMGRQFVDID